MAINNNVWKNRLKNVGLAVSKDNIVLKSYVGYFKEIV